VSELFPEHPPRRTRPGPTTDSTDDFNQVRRQYARAREYCGFTLDELINSRAAQRYLREIWLLGCMVRKPYKANILPPGNPFRTRTSGEIAIRGRSEPLRRAYDELPDGGT
jgi:hypothetical protein